MTETAAERIARRYPKSRWPKRTWLVVAIILMAIGTPWLMWSAITGANPPVSGTVSAYKVLSDSEIEVTVRVQRPDPSLAVTCTVVSQAVSYETVGQLPVDFAPSTEKIVEQRVVVRTVKRATSASLMGCAPKR